jgi:glycosyltransferase involved in cell wall biosynthesis
MPDSLGMTDLRSLFITRRFLDDGEAPVTGSYQRMAMFLEALGRVSDSLEVLVMAPAEYVAGDDADARMRGLYAGIAGREVALTIVPREPVAPPPTVAGLVQRPWDLYSPAVFAYYQTAGARQVAAVAAALARAPDMVFVHRLTAMAPLLRGGLRHGRILFDLDDIEHRSHVRQVFAPPHWGSKFLRLLHTPTLMRAERQAVTRSVRTYVCSAGDRDRLARQTGGRGIVAIPNAVRLPVASPVPAAPTLLFLGSAIFAPNLHGANWLIEQVMPRIRAAMPQARLVLAGEHQRQIRAHAAPPPGVEFRGFVDDLDALYRETRVVTCPIMSGSGTRVKLVEAAAHGRAIVSTHLGAEGIPLPDGEAILLRDKADAFAAACLELLRDHARASALGAAARKVAEARFDRTRIIERIAQDMLTVQPR